MSIFDSKRLTNETFKLDIERMRRGWYSDKYFENINRMLTTLSAERYNYSGKYHNLPEGVSIVGEQTVLVQAGVSPIESSVTLAGETSGILYCPALSVRAMRP